MDSDNDTAVKEKGNSILHNSLLKMAEITLLQNAFWVEVVLVFGSYLQLNTSRASLKILKGPQPAVGRVGPGFAMKFSFLRRGPQSPPLRQNCLD